MQRLAVAPVEVVGDEQERPPGREDRPGDGVEQPLPLLALGQRLRARETGHRRQQFGEQAGEFGEVRPVQLLARRAPNPSARSQATTGP